MAWTEKDIEALQGAIAQGALRVKFADREITYRSLDEMMRLLETIRESVRGKPKPKAHTFDYRRGY